LKAGVPELKTVEKVETNAAAEFRNVAADLEILNKYGKLRASGKNEEAIALFHDDAKWVTLYKTALNGKSEIQMWMDREKEKGRANLQEGSWAEDGPVYSRALSTQFPRGGLHEVVQSVAIEKGLIKMVEIKPKWKAHQVVIDFAIAREKDNDKTALDFMDTNVTWKTWDNVEITGKEEVEKLMALQRQHGEKREGLSDFEALGDVTHDYAMFERSLEIQRPDGVKVRSTQTLTVRGDPLKIVEVYVHPEEEMKDGNWGTPLLRERSQQYNAPNRAAGQTAADPNKDKAPKCGCALM
jgi:hypothetical protein